MAQSLRVAVVVNSRHDGQPLLARVCTARRNVTVVDAQSQSITLNIRNRVVMPAVEVAATNHT